MSSWEIRVKNELPVDVIFAMREAELSCAAPSLAIPLPKRAINLLTSRLWDALHILA